MRCPSCDSEVAADARFCANCGRSLGGSDDERRVVTVLFADIVGFTSLSERLDPERVKILVDRCFEVVAAEIHAFGGRVDKIVGDAVIAIFGAPVAHPDDAERAVRAGLRLHEVFRGEAETLGFDLRLRVGINSGEVLIGAMRAAGSVTAMGDVVNTAARLQTAAEPGWVLVGPDTHGATADSIEYRSHGNRIVRGRAEEVEVWQAIAPVTAPGARRRRRDLPLIGRDDEFALLRSAIDTSIGDRRALFVLLTGDVGVGKSRLADEVATWAALDHGAVARESRCLPYGEANVWWPVADVLRSGLGIADGDDEETIRSILDRHLGKVLGEARDVTEAAGTGDVARVADGLATILGLEPGLPVDAATSRDEATRAMILYTRALGAITPLVLQISDLHVGDAALLRLIDEVMAAVPARPIVVVATAHPSLLERWQPTPGRHNLVALHLDPLSREAGAQLLREMTSSDLPAELSEALLTRSGGNPFFLEELVGLVDVSVTDTGTVQVVPADGAPPVTAPVQLGDSSRSLPATLRGLVAARLDELDPTARSVIGEASVIGSRGSVDTLVHLVSENLGMEAGIAADVIDRLADDDLIDLDAGSWSFRSVVVRDVAYDTLTKADRARAHLIVANYLEEETARRRPHPTWLVDQLALHHGAAARLTHELGEGVRSKDLAGDQPARARRWTVEAAARAEREGAPLAAVRRYRSALELAGIEGVEPSEVAALQLRLADAAVEAWDLGGAADAAEAAVEAAPEDASVAASAAEVRGAVAHHRGDAEVAVVELSRAVDAFDGLGDVAAAANARRLRAMAEIFGDRLDDAEGSAGDALAGFESVGDLDGQGWALHHLAWIAFVRGEIDVADSHLRAAIERFSEAGDTRGLAWARGLSAWVRFRHGDVAGAGVEGAEVLAEARSRSDPWASAMMTTLLGAVALASGRPAEGAALAAEAERDFRGLGNLYGSELAKVILGRSEAMAADPESGIDGLGDLGDLDEGWHRLLGGSKPGRGRAGGAVD